MLQDRQVEDVHVWMEPVDEAHYQAVAVAPKD
jgi:hypothetical protein